MNFNFGEVLTRAWQITWKYKVLWIFGILAGCSEGSGGGRRRRWPRGGRREREQSLPPVPTVRGSVLPVGDRELVGGRLVRDRHFRTGYHRHFPRHHREDRPDPRHPASRDRYPEHVLRPPFQREPALLLAGLRPGVPVWNCVLPRSPDPGHRSRRRRYPHSGDWIALHPALHVHFRPGGYRRGPHPGAGLCRHRQGKPGHPGRLEARLGRSPQ